MPTKKQNKTSEVLEKIFRDSSLLHGLKEFEEIDFQKVLNITEEEKGKFYIKDIKSGKLKFVFDELNQKSRPEEIVRQLWLYKLNNFYKYPLEIAKKGVEMAIEKDEKEGEIILANK